MTNNQETNTTDVEKAFEAYMKEPLETEMGRISSRRNTVTIEQELVMKHYFTAGARSRDTEIEKLKDQLREAVRVINEINTEAVSIYGVKERIQDFLTKHQLNSEEGR